MGFVGVCKAVYDYTPQADGELGISEGDLLYILSKSGEDGWWKAKKKAVGDDDDEPEGLIPNNYVEEAHPLHNARALYDYTRQTDEEVSFSEDARIEVFDTSDPDWILAGVNGEYGFVPANYIDISGETAEAEQPAPALPTRTVEAQPAESDEEPEHAVRNPAAALAGIIANRPMPSVPSEPQLPPRPQVSFAEDEEEEEPTPALPARPVVSTSPPPATEESYGRPRAASSGVIASPPYNRATFRGDVENDAPSHAPGGFRLYNINEMVSVMGKNRKMPTTLGINLATGTIMIAPEKARDGPQQEWTADRMTHYSIESKHIFLELVRPSRSVDFHAGTKDTAQEIVSILGELAGAVRAEGLREVIMAGNGHSQKKGQVLYDFMAQGDDEVTVAAGDEVIILDDTQSDEWWQLRRVKNGKEGVVPRSYIEITGVVSPQPSSSTGINAGRSNVQQNRAEEERLAKEALRTSRRDEESRSSEVGPGMRLPDRGSSLAAKDANGAASQRSRRDSGRHDNKVKSKPDLSKVRTWNDRSKSFSVDAQFLALKDGKIHLHKMNGVKIAVPVTKMSVEDLEYVERLTGQSLDEDKPLSDIKKQQSRRSVDAESSRMQHAESARVQHTGATVEQPKKPEYDWFQFFLSCDVQVGLCERYAQAFARDSMDESVLPDVDATVLRNLGLREGDIIKVMRFLENKFNRTSKKVGSVDAVDGEPSGGLFSGPGGVLRNNTRKGRPAPPIQTNDVVNAKAFLPKETQSESPKPVADSVSTPLASAPAPAKSTSGGFDDDAWEVKPTRQPEPDRPSAPPTTALPNSQPTPQQPARPSAPPALPPPTLTGSMQELSLLSTPLEPVKAQPTAAPQPPITQPVPPPQIQSPPAQQQAVPPQPTGVTPAFFAGLGPVQNGIPNLPTVQYPQQTGYMVPQTQQSIARSRPTPPQMTQTGSLAPPPPQRPLSAPQSAQQSAFGPPPLQPQMTGMPNSASAYQAQIAPPGQSLAEINQMRMQQQSMQGNFGPQPTGMMPQPTGFGQFPSSMQPNGFGQAQMQPQPTGFPQGSFMNNQPTPSSFSDPRHQQFQPLQPQPTGFQSSFPQPQYPQATGVNSYLPPAMQPQKTGFMPSQPTGVNGFGQSFSPPPIPPIPQQPPSLAPLQPQKTGPAPPVRFGVTHEAKKLAPQPTGRRANLAQATPQNPFGF